MFIKGQTQQTREYVEVPFPLFAEETLIAAQEDLGDEVITDKFIEIYQLGIDAQSRSSKVSAAQLKGIAMTHKKIERWMQESGAMPATPPARIRHQQKKHDAMDDLAIHIRNLEAALLFLKQAEQGGM